MSSMDTLAYNFFICYILIPSLCRFKYTVRFCLWSGEEQGLYGSRAYASKMKQDGENIIAVLNGDMLGMVSYSSVFLYLAYSQPSIQAGHCRGPISLSE